VENAAVTGSEEQVAKNEVLFREFNERVEDVAGDLEVRREGHSPSIDFVCECGQLDCLERLELTPAQYEAVRSDPRRFVVVPGHEDARVARVVEQHDSFVVVQKLDEAAEIAIEHDPRSS
jgi:hypothetical protein